MLTRLDNVLDTPTKVAVLRLLCTNRKQFTGRDIARRVGRGVVNVHRALQALAEAGVVEAESQAPVKLFRIADDNPLVRDVLVPLFVAEARVDRRLWRELVRAGGEDLVSLILFGSQARGDAKPGSDTDLLVVLKGGGAAERIRAAAVELSLRQGLSLQPLFVTLEDLPRWATDSPDLWRGILADGVVIHGASLYRLERYVSQGLPVSG